MMPPLGDLIKPCLLLLKGQSAPHEQPFNSHSETSCPIGHGPVRVFPGPCTHNQPSVPTSVGLLLLALRNDGRDE